MSVVKRFEKNKLGRDFIVGDIHGSYDLLLSALKAAHFHIKKDRLFCTGDLVDRGLSSPRAANFLRLPYVFSVAGNHEKTWEIAYPEDGSCLAGIVDFMAAHNGGSWWKELSEAQQYELVGLFKNLPLAIELETERGTVGLIHGEVPIGMDWKTFLDRLEVGDEKVEASCVEGRRRIQSLDESGVVGIDRLFVGHSIQQGGVTRLGNIFYLDTGAERSLRGRSGALSLADAMAKTQILSMNFEQRPPVELINLCDEVDMGVAFGCYSL